MKKFMQLLQNENNPYDLARRVAAPICKERLDYLINKCSDCDTTKHCDRVATWGNPNANILIINDVAMSDKEVNDYFFSFLSIAELDTKDVFIINAVSCDTKRTDGSRRLPTKSEMNNCRDFVSYAIKFVDPRAILSMGATSFEMFKEKGTFKDLIEKDNYIKGIKAFVTYSTKNAYSDLIRKDEFEANKKEEHIVKTIIKTKEYIYSIRRD